MKDLYLMRHGETLFNQRRKIQGWCDSPLTEKGIEQAQKAGELLKDIHFDHCYSSTAERCCDTLELVTHQPYQRLKGIKERYFGVFEGESEDLNPPVDKYDDFFPIYGGRNKITGYGKNGNNAKGYYGTGCMSDCFGCITCWSLSLFFITFRAT